MWHTGRDCQGYLQTLNQEPIPTHPPYRREETEDIGSHSGLTGRWDGPSRSEAQIPSCSICSSRASHSGVPGEELPQVHCIGLRPGDSQAEPSLQNQRLREAM